MSDPIVFYADGNRLIVLVELDDDNGDIKNIFIDVKLSNLPDKYPKSGNLELNSIYYHINPVGDLYDIVSNQLKNGGWPILGNNYLDLDDYNIDSSEVNLLIVMALDNKEKLVEVLDIIIGEGLHIIGNNDYKLEFNKIDYIE